MITKLSQIYDSLITRANQEKNPLFKRCYLVETPGLSKEELNNLVTQFPLIDKTYLKVLSEYNFLGALLNDFALYAYDWRNRNKVEDFINAQEDPFFPKEFMAKHNMYQIGSYDADIIALTSGTDQFHEGEILFIDEGDPINPQDEQIHPLAKDFEQFLIIAGNLDEVHTQVGSNDSNYEEKKAEFLARLKHLGVDEKYYPAWLSVF